MSHVVASGMGGIRTAGDLVARMEMTRGMRLREAKAHVAGRLGVTVGDLSDPVAMLDVRKERGLGTLLEAGEITYVDDPSGLEAKFHIAETLGVPINAVERFRAMTTSRRPTG